jgi:SAM-dependent methyltransferase
LPFESSSFDLVYTSHVLEHFLPRDANRFVKECLRIMRSGAILRLVVPDLELIVRSYLHAFDKCDSDPHSVAMHDWSIIQLIDQCTREEPGGEMIRFLKEVDLTHASEICQKSMTARKILLARLDGELKPMRDAFNASSDAIVKGRGDGLLARLVGKLRLLARPDNQVDFENSGEKHKWMYDRKSLTRLLMRCGFRECEIVNPTLSRYPQWAKFHLDSGPDGSVYRPDSLYIEAIK